MEERFFYLLKQRITGIANQDEEKELNQLLEDNEEFRQLYTILFRNTSAMSEEDLLETEQAFASHSVKMQLSNMFDESEKASAPFPVATKPSRNKLYWAMAVAGAFIGFAFFYFKSSMNLEEPPQKNEVATRKGSKSKITLPDSTVVWLNADSRIIYSDNFRGNKREVQLTGEAFFEVAKDARRPFIIHTNTIDVKVLGTVFNVRSYPEETTTETSLLTGEVEITVLNQDKKVILKPNEKLIVPNKLDTISSSFLQQTKHKGVKQPLLTVDKIHFKEEDSLYAETCWVDNKLDFDAEQLDRMASKIERWYNVEVIINNEKLKTARFTATFENESLREVLEALSFSYSFKYKMEGGKVIIY